MTYFDSGPDAIITADTTLIDADRARLASHPATLTTQEQATPNYLVDQISTLTADLNEAEQQKQLDYVANVLGETGPDEEVTEATGYLNQIDP